ncbi:MAG TPA: hypothetical protein VE781_09705 [Kineosporiaceae bacterium]|jgi:hypothetical protein|nr:hypothetical protein [Kineosporiaceae bacterium]
MGLGLDVQGSDAHRLRRVVVEVCRRHGLLLPDADTEPYVDDVGVDLDLADDLVAVEVYPDEQGLSLDLSALDDSAAAADQFARVLRDVVEDLVLAGATVLESDGGAVVDPRRIGHLVPGT